MPPRASLLPLLLLPASAALAAQAAVPTNATVCLYHDGVAASPDT